MSLRLELRYHIKNLLKEEEIDETVTDILICPPNYATFITFTMLIVCKKYIFIMV